MREKIKKGLLTIVAVFIFATSYYLIDRFSFEKEFPYYEVIVNNKDFFSIGVIGDSWVARKKLDTLLHEGLLEKGINNKIISSGQPSARSKLIYQNMFKDSTNKYSSKFLIKKHPDYCIVIAGVNDAIGQIGANFYSHHMILIIKNLLYYNIKPVIVELPEFGIVEHINNKNTFNRMRYIISSKFNNKGEIDNIKTYRKNLNKLLMEEKLNDKIIFIDFDNICSNYEDCKDIFKKDGAHLNEEGNKLLSENIVNVLTKQILMR
ncbi:MAG: SGNH/GDSL hydrolase family protein [Algibacter sp.]|uniref:SGNH/GDSL hydrolase family protein n=1 Tax=Algibacter sp. TaxID=1872428 RepID=UPI002623FB5F|nr:SGNH/GDSL hydrolase family protein [Algibacter sp.]MDG1728682.1 SGNH/GDSL hydrolase family protein [Algibacter sp.]